MFYVTVIDATEQRCPLVPSTFADDVLHKEYTTVSHEGNLCYLIINISLHFIEPKSCLSSAENLDTGSSF